jgi:hypothetical protein
MGVAAGCERHRTVDGRAHGAFGRDLHENVFDHGGIPAEIVSTP